MIAEKLFDGELWIRAEDHSKAMKKALVRKPLTPNQIESLFPEKCSDDGLSPYWYAFARAIEEAHGIGEQK